MTPRQRAYADEMRSKPSVEDGIVVLNEQPGRKLVEYQPGNGTRYVLMLTGLEGLPDAARRMGCQDDSWVVTDVATSGDGRQPIIVGVDSYLAPHYFAERTGYGMADSVALCELLAHLIGCSAMTVEEYVEQHVDP